MFDGIYELLTSPVYSLLITFSGAVVGAILAILIVGNRRFKFSHKIAVIGFPRSGKTTLIAMLFSELISSEMARRIRVSGSETTRRITEYYHRILSGKNVGPSSDEDVFSYRFEYRASIFPFYRRNFDVEIVDFPGEYSSRLAERGGRVRDEAIAAELETAESPENELDIPNSSDPAEADSEDEPDVEIGMYDSAYQSWVTQADEYIIVVDTVDLLSTLEDAARVQSRIYTAVVELKESSIDKTNSLHRKDVALVISKSDIIANETHYTRDYVKNSNYLTANELSFNDDFFEKYKKVVLDRLRPTISLLKNNFRKVDIIFHSAYMRSPVFDLAERKLIEFVLPGSPDVNPIGVLRSDNKVTAKSSTPAKEPVSGQQ